MKTECTTNRIEFHHHFSRKVTGAFDGGAITSDGGALILRDLDAHVGLMDAAAGCFTDHRNQNYVEHSVKSLLAQRIYGLALGYEDLNDHDQLRQDPLLAMAAGKADCQGERRRTRDKGKALAGKSTLNRLELATPEAAASDRYKKIGVDERKMEELFVDLFLRVYGKEAPDEIILDLDATDDPLHGQQEGRFFHGYYRDYCYLPLYIFCGDFLLCAKLRKSDIDASAGADVELARIIERIRARWPKVKIILRADSGFCREWLMKWCEDHGVDYLFGLAKNGRLIREISEEMLLAKAGFDATGQAARVFKAFQYQTFDSWSRPRRVIGKAEHLSQGPNPRFIVTSLAGDPKALYEKVYCARGNMENRIKEQQLYLFADRTSAATLRANQIRLWLSSLAYSLLNAARHLLLKGTELANAQCHTLRLKLLKIGATVRITARRIWISFASAFPYARILRTMMARLKALPNLRC